jgi:transcription elongation factor Elf1
MAWNRQPKGPPRFVRQTFTGKCTNCGHENEKTLAYPTHRRSTVINCGKCLHRAEVVLKKDQE